MTKLRLISKWIMGIGILMFLTTPLMLYLFDADTDVVGVLIFIIGILIYFGCVFYEKNKNKTNGQESIKEA